MEIDPINLEKSEQQLRWSSSDEQSLGRVRLYRCTFCRRGFSNAQALGGHMNIHRKDRAKLRELSTDNNLLSLNISDQEAASHRINSADELAASPSESDDPIPKGEKNNDRENNPLLLPLFVETPSPSNSTSVVRDCSDGAVPSASPELDLELRLGGEATDKSKIISQN